MHPDADSIGRISASPPLRPAEVDELADLSIAWAPTRLGMVLRGLCDRDVVVAELRALIEHHLRPRGVVLHGLVVVRTPDGDVFTVAARRNRVTSRQLWTAGDEPVVERPRVIDLESRRRLRRPSVGDAPAG